MATFETGLSHGYVLRREETDPDFRERIEEAQCGWMSRLHRRSMELAMEDPKHLRWALERMAPILFGPKKARNIG